MTKAEQSRIQKEIVDTIQNGESGRLLLAPRVGKSKITIDLIKREKPGSILWVTPSIKLAEEDIPEEFTTWKAKSYLKKLTTCTWMGLHKMRGHFDVIYLDEEQFATENNIEPLLSGQLTCNVLRTLTGTPSKHDHKKDLYKSLQLKVLVNLNINSAVDLGLLANYKIKVVEVDMGTDKNIEAGNAKKRFMTSEESQYKYLHNTAQQSIFGQRKDMMFRILARMRAIKDSPAKTEAATWLLDKLSGRKLTFASTIKQAEKLCEHTYHSKTDNVDLQKFMAGEINEIAMVNAGGTGFTYKEIDYQLLTQVDSDKNGLTSQKIARTLLNQENYEATIILLSLIGTQDEKWVASVLENFDESKVEYIRFKNLKNGSVKL